MGGRRQSSVTAGDIELSPVQGARPAWTDPSAELPFRMCRGTSRRSLLPEGERSESCVVAADSQTCPGTAAAEAATGASQFLGSSTSQELQLSANLSHYLVHPVSLGGERNGHSCLCPLGDRVRWLRDFSQVPK